jgi:dTDP-L-rhamnose 4-epimerase
MEKQPGRTRVLVTGGAGFIGSHVVDALMAEGHEVGIIDSLVPQVHGDRARTGTWPTWTLAQIKRGAWAMQGDIRARDDLRLAFDMVRPHVVIHLAAEVGVGQAEYEIERYVDVNVRGTAILLEELLRYNDRALGLEGAEATDGVRRIVAAGSMSSYGEGAYRCPEHGFERPVRSAGDLAEGRWEPRCVYRAATGCEETPIPERIEEWSSLAPSGIYAATKRDTEELVLMTARSRGFSAAVARFFNVYGPRQALGNPYTGVAAIFASRCIAGQPPLVYEDGAQARDFIHVSDVAAAVASLVGPPQLRLALREWAQPVRQGAFNVGTGMPTTILDVARLACAALRPDLEPEVTGQYRVGDVRACIANPLALQAATGWTPKVHPEAGLTRYMLALRTEQIAMDEAVRISSMPDVHSELVARGLLLKVGAEVEDLPEAEKDAELDDEARRLRLQSAWSTPDGVSQAPTEEDEVVVPAEVVEYIEAAGLTPPFTEEKVAAVSQYLGEYRGFRLFETPQDRCLRAFPGPDVPQGLLPEGASHAALRYGSEDVTPFLADLKATIDDAYLALPIVRA